MENVTLAKLFELMGWDAGVSDKSDKLKLSTGESVRTVKDGGSDKRVRDVMETQTPPRRHRQGTRFGRHYQREDLSHLLEQ